VGDQTPNQGKQLGNHFSILFKEIKTMQDAITTLINSSDVQGKYLDSSGLDKLKSYYQSGELRAKAAIALGANASTIITQAVARSLMYTDITAPGGNMYTCRRYAACIRDLDYFLRYATYAMLAGDPSILDERILNGLRETYNSLGVPIGATIRAVQAMKDVTADLLGAEAGKEMGVYFDHIAAGLS
jgi:allophycocyanin beta subunit